MTTKRYGAALLWAAAALATQCSYASAIFNFNAMLVAQTLPSGFVSSSTATGSFELDASVSPSFSGPSNANYPALVSLYTSVGSLVVTGGSSGNAGIVNNDAFGNDFVGLAAGQLFGIGSVSGTSGTWSAVGWNLQLNDSTATALTSTSLAAALSAIGNFSLWDGDSFYLYFRDSQTGNVGNLQFALTAIQSAVPEPATLPLTLIGFGGLVLARRRSTRKSPARRP